MPWMGPQEPDIVGGGPWQHAQLLTLPDPHVGVPHSIHASLSMCTSHLRVLPQGLRSQAREIIRSPDYLAEAGKAESQF